MYCVHCGNELTPNGNFCPSCGKSAALDTLPQGNEVESRRHPKIVPPRPSFKGLRMFNWGLALLMSFGMALMLIKAPTATGIAIIVLVGMLALSFPVVSAVALGNEDLSLLGLYINISTVLRHRLRRAALILNWVICIFGVMGLVACLVTGQIGPMASMLFYVLPPIMNIKALRELTKFEQEYSGYAPASSDATV
jgi:hypothetical protein